MKRIVFFHALGTRSLSAATVAAMVSGVMTGPGVAQTSGNAPPPQTTQGDLSHLVYTRARTDGRLA